MTPFLARVGAWSLLLLGALLLGWGAFGILIDGLTVLPGLVAALGFATCAWANGLLRIATLREALRERDAQTHWTVDEDAVARRGDA